MVGNDAQNQYENGWFCTFTPQLNLSFFYISPMPCPKINPLRTPTIFNHASQGRVHAGAKRCHGIGGPKFGIGRLRENFPVFSPKTLSLRLRPASHWLTPIWHRSKLGLQPPLPPACVLKCDDVWSPPRLKSGTKNDNQ